MTVGLTGTPGVGKTTVAEILRNKGLKVLDLNNFIEDHGLRENRDIVRDSYEVNINKLRNSVDIDEHEVIEGHLSHYLELEPIIVLRCEPNELKKRMETKDWTKRKIKENIEAEVMDVILIEALDQSDAVCEIDTTEKSPEEVATEVIDVLKGNTDKYPVGKIDWTSSLTQL
ncbi:MAG: adenylate kinase family protein [Thermoplasmatota archaeon]